MKNSIDRDNLIEALQKIEDEFPTTREHILITIKKTKDFILSLPTNTESREVGQLILEIADKNEEINMLTQSVGNLKHGASEKDKEIEELRKELSEYKNLAFDGLKKISDLKSKLPHTPPVAEGNAEFVNKLEKILDGYRDDSFGTLETKAELDKLYLSSTPNLTTGEGEVRDERPTCHICNKKIDDKDFTYDGESIVVHRSCLKPLTIEQCKAEVARKSVFIIQGETLFLHGCFSNREKAEKYISGNDRLKIQEVEVI